MGYLDLILKDIRRIERNLRLSIQSGKPDSAQSFLSELENKTRELRAAVHRWHYGV